MMQVVIMTNDDSIELTGNDRRLGFVEEPPASWFLVLPGGVSECGEMAEMTADKMLALIKRLAIEPKKEGE